MARTRTVRSGSPKPLFLALLLALTLALALPGAASAAGWVSAPTITESPLNNTAPPTVQIGVDSAGDGALAYLAGKGGTTQDIQATARPAGGAWTSPTELGTTTSNNAGPALAADNAGNALVAFVNTTTATNPCVA